MLCALKVNRGDSRRRRRRNIRVPVRVGVTVVAALAGSVSSAATATVPTSAATASAARAPTVKLAHTALGKILVDGSGSTLYMFTEDRRDQDRCAGVSGCLGIWPALTTTKKPVAGPKVRSSLLGTIKFHGDVRQITYAGHPLYTYALDFGSRSTLYVGAYEYGGSWYALAANGKAVR
jgi:predicted lipoprotein with Yx(FWY)xxD motif